MSVQQQFNKIFRPELKDLTQQTEEQNEKLRYHRNNTQWKHQKYNRLPLMAERVEK